MVSFATPPGRGDGWHVLTPAGSAIVDIGPGKPCPPPEAVSELAVLVLDEEDAYVGRIAAVTIRAAVRRVRVLVSPAVHLSTTANAALLGQIEQWLEVHTRPTPKEIADCIAMVRRERAS